MNPSEVRAKIDMKKGEFTLVPLTMLSKISAKTATAKCFVKSQSGDFAFSVDAPMRPSQLSDWKPDVLFAAYFWLTSSTDQSEANMKVSSVVKNGYIVPTLVNFKAVKKGDQPVIPEASEPVPKKARS